MFISRIIISCLLLIGVGISLEAQSDKKRFLRDDELPKNTTIYTKEGSVLNGDVIANENGKLISVLSATGDTIEVPYGDINRINSLRNKRFVGKLDKYPAKAYIMLRNGQNYNGYALSESGSSMVFQKDDGEIVTISHDNIWFFRRKHDNMTFNDHGHFHYNKGIFASVSMNVADRDLTRSFNLTLGYRANDKLSYGLGFGFNNYRRNFNEGNVTLDFSVFTPHIYGRYNLTTTPVRLFVSGQLGYGLATNTNFNFFENQYSGGIFFAPSIGITHASRRLSRATIEIGYAIQPLNGSFETIDFRNNTPITSNYSLRVFRPTIKIGFDIK